MSQSSLATQLRETTDPATRLDIALKLLEMTFSRQHIDAALEALSDGAVKALLGDQHRPILRQKALHYFEHPDKDKAGMIREKIIRLLVEIGHPDDTDLYRMGVEVYEHQPVLDVAQNLRAASLAGLAPIDSGLACIYATKFLGEADTSHFNCEPAMTAIDVLVAHNHRLPIYQFLLLRGRDFVPQAKGEVVGKALESLGRDFPSSLYIPLAQNYLELDVPIVTIGVINHIIENRVAGLYAMLENIISETRHWDLHRAAVISLAASRDETLWALLYRMAKFAPEKYVANFIEAVELTYGAERDVVLRLLALTPNPSPKGRRA